jgi:membrane protein DedA with SNARE-associated domain
MDLIEHARQVMEQGQPWVSHYGLAVIAASGFGQAITIVGTVVPGLAVNLAAGYYCADGTLSLPLAAVAAWLGFNATTGLLAVITTIVGAAAGANLALVTLDIAWDRQVRDRFASAKAEEIPEARASTV